MRSVGTRFVLPFGLLAILFSIFLLYRTHETSQRHAADLVSQQVALALEFNLAIRDYAANKIRPVMEELLGKDGFMLETMSTSFISRSIFEEVRKKFPDYIIRFASEDPRNPVNKANSDEQRMMQYFRTHREASEWTGEVQFDGKRYLARFVPKWVKPDCLRCHGDPKDAPATLLKRYGSTASFHKTVGDVAGLDTVAIPLDKMHAALMSETRKQSLVLVMGLALLFGSVIGVFRFVVTRRLGSMAHHFRTMAAHPESSSLKPLEVGGTDEIGVVGAAFNELVEQLHAIQASLEERVRQRTAELAHANEELRRNRSMLTHILNSVPQSIFWKDREGAFLGCNEPFIRAVGVERADQVIGKTDFDLPWQSEEAEAYRADDREVIEHRRPKRHIREPLRRADGTRSWIETTKVPLTDETGEVYGVLGVHEDITERKQAEEALRRSEEKFQKAFNASPALMAISTIQEGRFLDINDRFVAALGFPREEVIGKTAVELKIFSDPEQRAVLIQKLKENGHLRNYETAVRTRTGELRCGRFSAEVIEVQGTQYLLTVMNDITEQRQNEELLRHSRQMLGLVLDTIPAVVFWKDCNSVYLGCNRRCAADAGLASPEEIVGKTDQDLPWKGPQADSFQADDRAVMETGRPKMGIEEPETVVGGRTIWLRTSKIPLRDSDGRIIGVLGTAEDITESRQAEEQLRKYVEEIEHFNRLATGREHRIIELKKTINELSAAAGQPPPFDLSYKESTSTDDDNAPPRDSLAASHLDTQSEDHDLTDLIDLDQMQRLLDHFCDAMGIASAVIDLKGHVLIGARWQRICTDFHRPNERTCSRCIESDTLLAGRLKQGERFSMYQCPNGLIDAASPIVIEGRHRANMFIGQFLIGPADETFFRRQAAEFGFDETSYLEALSRVPHVPKEKLPAILGFLTSCAELIGTMGLERLRQKATEADIWHQAQELDTRNRELQRQRKAAVSLAEDAEDARIAAEHSEIALRESEERYRRITQAVTDYIYTVRVENGRAVETIHGPACEVVTGYASDELRSDPSLWIRMVHEDDRPAVLAQASRVLSGETPEPLEHRIRRKDGALRWVQSTAVAHRGSKGRITSYDGLIRDITERKELADQLQQAQKMEAVGQLASGVAHDFNNLLTVILGNVELIKLSLEQNEDISTSLNAIGEAAQQAAGVTRSLLTFSRKVPPEKRRMDLCETVEKTTQMLRRVLPASIELIVETPRQSPLWINADATQLQQVIMNLAVNARDAMPEGGTLWVTASLAAAGEGGLPADSPPSEYPFTCLTVSDTGIGMSPEVQSRIFEPFFTTKPRGHGTGLGLSIIGSIVREHGGRIEVDSSVGRGTTFKVFLPRVQPGIDRPATRRARPEARGKGERILLAEDDVQILETLTTMLRSEGYRITAVETGPSILEAFNQDKEAFRLLLFDVDLPKRSGVDCLCEIRAGGCRTPAIVMTGRPDPSLDAKLPENTRLVRKPFRIAELKSLIARTLNPDTDADAGSETP